MDDFPQDFLCSMAEEDDDDGDSDGGLASVSRMGAKLYNCFDNRMAAHLFFQNSLYFPAIVARDTHDAATGKTTETSFAVADSIPYALKYVIPPVLPQVCGVSAA